MRRDLINDWLGIRQTRRRRGRANYARDPKLRFAFGLPEPSLPLLYLPPLKKPSHPIAASLPGGELADRADQPPPAACFEPYQRSGYVPKRGTYLGRSAATDGIKEFAKQITL